MNTVPDASPPSTRGRRPVIALTMGDPAGIGPELCLRALNTPAVLEACVPAVVGSWNLLQRVARTCGLPPPPPPIRADEWSGSAGQGAGLVLDCGELDAGAVRPGEVQAACGKAAYTFVQAATHMAMDGRVAALATAPIHKEALALAGVPHPGHTEILAALTGCRRYCMMLASDTIKVSLVTIHVSYVQAPRLITTDRIAEVIDLTREGLVRMGIAAPRLAVCALNPHAGEQGLFGSEEMVIIAPAIVRARARGADVEGPLPPDTAFLPGRRARTDAYIVMYHDQGLIPFKMLAFDEGVNITLGLPIVRTSVDHGTAFDMAWKGQASAGSLVQSVLWARRLAGV